MQEYRKQYYLKRKEAREDDKADKEFNTIVNEIK